MKVHWFYVIWPIYTAVVTVFIFSFCLADPQDAGWKGKVTRGLFYDFPAWFQGKSRSVLPSAAFSCVGKSINYVFNERNPLLQCGYLLILNGAYVAWLIRGQPRFSENKYAGEEHTYYVAAGIFVCHVTFYLACKTPPGRVTMENYPCYMHSPYDGTVFAPGKACSTCQVPKPPRSKHCSLCGICVPISDHHCVWLNQCVGELNYRWFLLFLAYHIFFFGYAAWIVSTLLVSKAVGLQGQIFHNRATQKDMKATAWLITRYLCTKETALVTVAMLAVAMCGAIGGFFGYHMYLQWHGMTTNESFKWDRAWKLYDRLLEVHDKARKEIEGFATGENMLEGEEEGGTKTKTNTKTKCGAGGELDYEQEEEPMAGCVGAGAMPRVVTSLTRQVIEGMQEGKPYEDMPLRHPGERPSNIYHRGFWRNLWNVAFPRALLAENVAKRGSGPKIEKIEKAE